MNIEEIGKELTRGITEDGYKDLMESVAKKLKAICRSRNATDAATALNTFATTWSGKYPNIEKS